ncbi:hypothetical protein WMY93_009202 [Mugilogobius chulae]|uniref:Uncharacterized protein n=1 Tax=Mugilogobius chulae TaxID=88201 RepID=A0AAW0PES3_9GOBI
MDTHTSGQFVVLPLCSNRVREVKEEEKRRKVKLNLALTCGRMVGKVHLDSSLHTRPQAQSHTVVMMKLTTMFCPVLLLLLLNTVCAAAEQEPISESQEVKDHQPREAECGRWRMGAVLKSMILCVVQTDRPTAPSVCCVNTTGNTSCR